MCILKIFYNKENIFDIRSSSKVAIKIVHVYEAVCRVQMRDSRKWIFLN